MYEVKIYGEIIGFEDPEAYKYGYCNLTHVQNQLAKARGKPVLVRINSVGGDCTIGFAIYHELRRYAAKNKVEIHTLGEANVCSIATIIFLAGDKRTLTETTSPFVHNAWTYSEGNAGVLIKTAQSLSEWDNAIAKHYSEHTDLSIQEAKELMKAETSISPSLALSMRFATEIEPVVRPKALKRFENKVKNKNSNMKKPSFIMKALAALKGGIVNKVVTTADETEINFPDVADDADPALGDMGEVDGEPATGEYVMKTGETYVFVDGELTEIVEAEEEVTPEEAAALIENLTTQLVAVNKELAIEKATVKALKTATSKPANAGSREVKKPEAHKAETKGSRAAAALKLHKENETKNTTK